jgi:xylulose-5-phosphate/fructose-6-phosphate phosphoketolase
VYPRIGGMRQASATCSARCARGIPSHVSPPTPGSIHEDGELGYVLMHAFGTVMGNPDLLAIAVVGDGEAETGPFGGSWEGISYLLPIHDGGVLPILHLNGYKISGTTVLGRDNDSNVSSLLRGHGYTVHWVEDDDSVIVHHLLARTMDLVVDEIQGHSARSSRQRQGDHEAALAVHCTEDPEGMDGSQGGRRRQDCGHFPRAPPASQGGQDQ